jgi:hypothetical protein
MRTSAKILVTVLQLGLLGALAGVALAQNRVISGAHTMALKSGESEEVQDIYWVQNCRSMLNGPPQIEVLDGPPGVTATLKEDMVLPREQNCPNKVKGAKLVVSAGQIDDPSFSQLNLRVTYDTREGIRKQSMIINLSLIP